MSENKSEETKESEKKIEFPTVGMPTVVAQNDCMYIAIPLDKVTPEFAGFYLDSVKMQYLKLFITYQQKKKVIQVGTSSDIEKLKKNKPYGTS